MPQLTIITTPSASSFPLPFSLEASTAELKLALAALIEDSGQVSRMVCGGRVLRDELTLEEQGVKDGAKIYVTVSGNGRLKSRMNSASVGALNAMNAMNKPDPLMGPLLKFLANNPELYQQMILSNPHLQGLLQSNPDLRHALSDPSTLKQILSAASNPAAYNEMLRGHDRAMQNLETIPEGFSHLQRVYKSMQEPMYEAMSNRSTGRLKDSISASSSTAEVRKELTKDPVPNPWAPTKTPSIGFKRKLPSSASSSFLFEQEEEMGEDYSRQLEMMHELGFGDDEGENLPALKATKGDVKAAIDWIISRRHQ